MPPSHHSSSSHSSSSHSFSSHSSGSSRSYSSSRSSSSFSRGPSSHSSTSHSSSYSSSPARKPTPAPPKPSRPRVNQPTGFHGTGGPAPRYVYGRRHEYIYYPVAWVDSSTGASYQKGYYDENGQRYDNVAFERNGKYENVVCTCPYCGRETILDLSSKDAGKKDLQCPGCGAPMEIKSELDEYLSGGSAETERSDAGKRRHPWRVGCLVAIAIFVVLAIIGSFMTDSKVETHDNGGYYSLTDGGDSNTDLFGSTLYLSRAGGSAYAIRESSSGADKTLVWSREDESYYDAESDCWLWYNTELDPPNWQYWYEGISSEFGDYGWMEHDEDGWFIEISNGNWVNLPAEFDASSLWYIED